MPPRWYSHVKVARFEESICLLLDVLLLVNQSQLDMPCCCIRLQVGEEPNALHKQNPTVS